MEKKRSYDEGCAAAHALDLVGERWALLVVRELLVGPKRFTDLKAGLPGVSPNVLSQRLRDLEAIGAVMRTKLPPPAASRVYDLTPWGRELEPVLMALGRWGVRSPAMPFTAPTSVAALVVALRTMFDPAQAEGFDGTVALRVGEEPLRARVVQGRLELVHGSVERPDVVVESDPETLKGLAFGGMPLSAALETGVLTLTGDIRQAERFFELFRLPEPVAKVRLTNYPQPP